MKVTGSEWYVLECLWEEEPQTLMSIFTRLNKTQGWAKSTCATMLKRMEEKNLIRHEEKGRTKYFYANTRRDEVAHKETRAQRLFSQLSDLLARAHSPATCQPLLHGR